MLSTALATVESWPWLQGVRTSPLLYPLLNGTHILGFAAMFGAVLVLHLGRLRDRTSTQGGIALTVARAAFAVSALTGLALFAVRATHYAVNPAFRLKAVLILLALANVALFHCSAYRWTGVARGSAMVSILLWTGVLLTGRWIGFA